MEYQRRLKSFYNVIRRGNKKSYQCKYPNKDICIKDLARAGFMYEGDGDCVRCPVCKIRVKDWVRGDNPITYHKLIMPECPFVQKK